MNHFIHNFSSNYAVAPSRRLSLSPPHLSKGSFFANICFNNFKHLLLFCLAKLPLRPPLCSYVDFSDGVGARLHALNVRRRKDEDEDANGIFQFFIFSLYKESKLSLQQQSNEIGRRT